MACESTFSDAELNGLHYQVSINSSMYVVLFCMFPLSIYCLHVMNFFNFCDTKVLEIELDDDSYKGMPFVLRSNQTWIKNSTSDFYLDFSRRAAKSSEVTLPFSFSPILAKNLLQKSSQNPMLIFFSMHKGYK
jgi:alpha-glucan,water dikinase